MKRSGIIRTPTISFLVSFVLLAGCHRPESDSPTQPTGTAASAPSPASAPGTTIDQRLNQLEQQVRAQQEENQKLRAALNDKPASGTQSSPVAASASSSPTSVQPPPPDPDAKFVHGWIARIMPVGTDARAVPSDELGHFDAEKDSYRIGDFVKETGFRSGVDVGWKGEAYLEATEQGRYTFSINFTLDNIAPHLISHFAVCWGLALVEGQTIGRGQVVLDVPPIGESVIKSVVGGTDLGVGRYRVEFWVACGDMRNEVLVAAVDNNALHSAMSVAFEVMIKRPSDAGPLSAARTLAIKVPKN